MVQKIIDPYIQLDSTGYISDSVVKNLSFVSFHRNDFSTYPEGDDDGYRGMKARKELPITDAMIKRLLKSLYVKVDDSIETLVDIRHAGLGGTLTSDKIVNFMYSGTLNTNFVFTFVDGSKSNRLYSYVSVDKAEVLISIDPEYLHTLPDGSELIVVYENKRVIKN